MIALQLDRPLVFFDIESTGTDAQADRIVELALVRYLPGEEDQPQVRTRRINPERPIPEEATAVHGITDEDVAGCPRFAQLADSLHAYLAGCDLAGFNIRRFDLPMLQAEFQRCGKVLDHRGRRLLDAQVVFHRQEPRNLEAAVQFYVGRELEGAHGAEADALATAEVLFAQIERYGLATDPGELHAWMDESHPFLTEVERWWDTSPEDPRDWVFQRGKHSGQRVRDTPRNYLSWMIGVADMDPGVREAARALLIGRRP